MLSTCKKIITKIQSLVHTFVTVVHDSSNYVEYQFVSHSSDFWATCLSIIYETCQCHGNSRDYLEVSSYVSMQQKIC